MEKIAKFILGKKYLEVTWTKKAEKQHLKWKKGITYDKELSIAGQTSLFAGPGLLQEKPNDDERVVSYEVFADMDMKIEVTIDEIF